MIWRIRSLLQHGFVAAGNDGQGIDLLIFAGRCGNSPRRSFLPATPSTMARTASSAERPTERQT